MSTITCATHRETYRVFCAGVDIPFGVTKVNTYLGGHIGPIRETICAEGADAEIIPVRGDGRHKNNNRWRIPTCNILLRSSFLGGRSGRQFGDDVAGCL
jgi:hypothetical protein